MTEKKICLMCNAIENSDRDPFLTSELFKGIPANDIGESMTIPSYLLDHKRYNTMIFDTIVNNI